MAINAFLRSNPTALDSLSAELTARMSSREGIQGISSSFDPLTDEDVRSELEGEAEELGITLEEAIEKARKEQEESSNEA